jgi:hypothetical protein
MLWLTLLALTGILPGCVTGILASARRWPRERCRATARRAGWSVLVACGLAAWLMGTKYPLGWVAESMGSTAALIPTFAWMAVADVAPRIIAERVAFPRLGA